MAIQHWDRMDNEKLIIYVEPKVFVMNTLRNLVLRLNYTQNLDLGLNTRKPGAVPTIFNFDPTQSHVQQERKERVQKCSKKEAISVTSNCLKTISL